MTLTKFLKALKTTGVLVTVKDSEKEICKIYSDGADALADDLEAREVSRWTIESSSGITVELADTP